MRKIVCIVGPTGVGKTALAFDLAKKFKGELVSADAVQVFKDLDIISGKDVPEGYKFHAGRYTRDGSPSIYLLDVVESTDAFTVSDFYHNASRAIEEILEQDNLPLIVGGTGLYVESLLQGLKPVVPPNLELRQQLEAFTVLELQKQLSVNVLKSMNISDRGNKRRLIRKIEIESSGKIKQFRATKLKYQSLVIGLYCDRETLKKRIDLRVDERLRDCALDEANKLFLHYDNLTQQVKDANGYKQLFSYIKKEIDLEEAIYRWKISEYKHAKNQMTWFRKYGDVEWHDIGKIGFKKNIEKRIREFMS